MQDQKTKSAETQENCSLFLDTSEAKKQLDELMELLKSRFPGGIPDELISDLASLTFDLVFTDSRSALGANGTKEVFQGFRFGSSFELFRAAVLTGKWDIHVNR
ncbi:MAG: hypothetical protein ABSG77_04845 [Candidatus Acidiferrum sp.]|jgi:hypothetical protein